MLKIGDWVTQYEKGYWQVIDLKPQYAIEDYSYKDIRWKKGDLIGQWVILKKGFTPKMKPRIAGDCVSDRMCKPVTAEEQNLIDDYFVEHPEFLNKFKNASIKIPICIYNIDIDLPEEKIEAFKKLLKQLPEKFTIKQFKALAVDYLQYCKIPPTSCLLQFFCNNWEITEDFDSLYHGYNLLEWKTIK